MLLICLASLQLVEFYINRLWKPSEFDKLVSITTERVNSVITNPETRIRSHSQGSRLQANPSKGLSFEQFMDMISSSKPVLDNLPEKVLIDARGLTPAAFQPLMRAYLAYKLQHPTHAAVLITGNQLTSQVCWNLFSILQIFQHTYIVGLQNQRCKIWHDPACLLRPQQELSSIFKAAIAGANAKILLDSGAAANCISEEFCRLMKLQIKPVKGTDMTTADGKTSQVKGVAVVSVTLQSYKAQLRFLVISMATDCDAILGEPWIIATKAVMTYGPTGLTNVRLYKGRTVRKIVQYPAESIAWANPLGLLNHRRFHKAALSLKNSDHSEEGTPFRVCRGSAERREGP